MTMDTYALCHLHLTAKTSSTDHFGAHGLAGKEAASTLRDGLGNKKVNSFVCALKDFCGLVMLQPFHIL